MTAHLEITDRTVPSKHGGIPVRLYRPTGIEEERPPLLWIHGGGFVSGGITSRESDLPAREIASLGRRVVTVDYRLAPNVRLIGPVVPKPHINRFPAAQDDIVDVASWLAGESGTGIHVGGASAGANLAATASLRLRDSDITVRSTVLAYGLFHAALPVDHDIEANLDWLARPVFKPALMRRLVTNYTGDEKLLDPGPAFPGGTDLRHFPPAILLDAEQDRLRASGRAFGRELRAAGVDVSYHVFEGARHGFLLWPRNKPFRGSVARIALWLQRHDAPDVH